ncbi:MAG TPA: hypothetical protein VFR85_15180 [Anaeromyxobacteraceae bacterium]|nr:hypothetical protein [Anaeromyxobacteraceae bacterium]
MVLEGRIGSDPFQLIANDIPPWAYGVQLTLDPATPELVVLGVRMRSVRDGRTSEYTPEATLLRGVRPPSALAVRVHFEDVALSWTQGSTVAEEVRVERAIWDYGPGQLGPYETVATLPGSASSWLDTTTAAPGVAYGYRIRNTATYQGTSIDSQGVAQMADQTTFLSPPAGLQAAVVPEGVLLTWTPTSRNGTVQQVTRDPELAGAIVTLDASARSYLDPVPQPGAYHYWVAVLPGPGLGGYAAGTGPVSACVPPPPGPWGLEQEVLHVPAADSVARDASGSWWFARRWVISFLADTGVWTQSPGGWEEHRLGGTATEFLVEPGLLLDSAGRPHVLWLLPVDPWSVSGPWQLRHAWRDEAGWKDEMVAERVFTHGNVRYDVQFAIDGAGSVHVAWEAIEFTGSTAIMLSEYATNASGTWNLVPLTSTILDPTRVSSSRLAVAPDGSVHVCLLGFPWGASEPSIVHLRNLAGGGWEEEVVPNGPLTYTDKLLLVARGADDLALLYTQQQSSEYRFQARTAGGWGASEALGSAYAGSGHLLPGLAVSQDGARRAALLELTDGLALATWEAGAGWSTSRIHQTVPFDVPWLGFDAAGALDILLPVAPAGTDGFTDRIHLRSTR